MGKRPALQSFFLYRVIFMRRFLMTALLEKRRSLHVRLQEQENMNRQLTWQMERLESLSNLGVVSAMIAHEMNNILTPIGNYAKLSLSNPSDGPLAKKALEKAAANCSRAGKILESMLAMALTKRMPTERYPVKDMVDEVFVLLARDFGKDRIRVNIDIERDVAVVCEKVTFQQVLMNLILNGREAILEKHTGPAAIDIRAWVDAGTVHIEIADDGCGIRPENIERIFEPFFTSKDSGSQTDNAGAGLGLAFCRRVVESLDGCLYVRSKEGEGTTFEIVVNAGA
jgi:hypothetical protein